MLAGFGDKFREELSIVWPKGATDTKPVGVFRVVDRSGRERLLAYFFMDGGDLEGVKCP